MSIYESRDFVPMLMHEEKEAFDDKNYIFELKFDGIRTLLFVEPEKILIRNKRNKKLNNTYPELLSIKNNVKKKCIFDGEIVLMKDGLPSFQMLQKRALLMDPLKVQYYALNHPVVFVCFDILYEDRDLTGLTLMERKKILEKYKNTDVFVKTIYTEEKGIKLYQAAAKQNLEGIIAKKKNSVYQINKRTKDWLKIKNWYDEDFYICAYHEYEDKPVASLVLGRKVKNGFEFVSKVTIGKRNPDYQIIKNMKERKPYLNFEKENYIFIEPKLEATVTFLEKTKNNGLRQPIFKGLRLD